MKKAIVIALGLIISIFSYSQKTEAYRVFNSKGKSVSTDKMLKELKSADIILIGEFHNNPISH